MAPPSPPAARAAAMAVIGGGPAGYFAAIAAARHLRFLRSSVPPAPSVPSPSPSSRKDESSSPPPSPKVDIIILESTSRPLRKVLVSGGGRCNVMHRPFPTPLDLSRQHYPRGRKEMVGPFTAFDQRATRDWFEAEDVRLKVEDDGRIFPVTDDAATVVAALEGAVRREGILVCTGTTVRVLDARSSGGASCSPEANWRFEMSVGVNKKSRQGPADGRGDLNTAASSPLLLRCDAVLLATGSSPAGFRLAKNLGQPVESTYPSLFSFRLCDGHALSGLQGVSVSDVELTLLPPPQDEEEGKEGNDLRSAGHVGETATAKTQTKSKKRMRRRCGGGGGGGRKGKYDDELTQRGPIIVTHRGLSGPASLRLSAFGAKELRERNYAGTLSLNLVPDLTDSRAVASELRRFAVENGARQLSTPPTTGGGGYGGGDDVDDDDDNDTVLPRLPRRLWAALLAHSNLDPNSRWSQLSNVQAICLAQSLTSLLLPFQGKDANKEEFVTAGGVELRHVNLKRMESKIVPGLFFAGEVLNVDGVTGGFNFQNCWSTGYVAGVAMAELVGSGRGRKT